MAIKDVHKLACQCGCGFSEISPKTLSLISIFGRRYDGDIVILSGARCETHNRNVGGSETSNHLKTLAVDFTCVKDNKIDQEALDKYSQTWVFNIYKEGEGVEMLRYDTFVHVAVREDRPDVFRNMRSN